MPRITRRMLLKGAAGAGAGALFPWLAACGPSRAPDAVAPGPPDNQPPLGSLPAFQFTDLQRKALSAAVARLVPAESAGDWSAADAGAVEFIEQLLNAFSLGGNPRIHGGGPFRPQFAQFHPLSRAKTLSWQREVLRLREVYADGLDDLNRQAAGPLSVAPADFAALPPPAQDAILEAADLENTPLFAALFEHTMQAVYGHPVYGGNKDFIAWKSLCYEGDVHGVRFPGGHDPAADDEPWRKFGGYSPDEMIQPTPCSVGQP